MWIINGTLVLVLGGTLTAAVLSVGNPSTASITTTRTTKVAKGTVTASVSASGNLASQTPVRVNFSGSGGTVTAIYVKVGQTVAKGQALAKVDDTSARQSLQSAKASLTSAQAQYATTVQGQTSQERARDQASITSAEVSLANAKTSLAQAQTSRALDKKQQDTAVASAQTTYDNATDATAKATDDDRAWHELTRACEKIDLLTVLPIHTRLVEKDLVQTDAQRYRLAARRLAQMRKIATGTSTAGQVDAFIKELRETHRHRPRLQQEFDRAGLP
jgi:multidrug efflux pump subunit AcrA (membrane-fusion protein)